MIAFFWIADGAGPHEDTSEVRFSAAFGLNQITVNTVRDIVVALSDEENPRLSENLFTSHVRVYGQKIGSALLRPGSLPNLQLRIHLKILLDQLFIMSGYGRIFCRNDDFKLAASCQSQAA